ncbi:hypothetical protein ANDA3_2490 [plant metagenome]|uniref:Beta-ketoacyl synthase N-terminal domain-containing protein n=2 Tax=root TaxID=1 RepID=A0A1C3K7Q5_9BURK|nr:hypothetical protein [Orrella dioscoreae]SBT27387.1 hypothetical protein ODI_03974 [Orrella dioscoreae]SOE50009.1 hypothetical protein ODI_R2450 [Orrella dioscoreae]
MQIVHARHVRLPARPRPDWLGVNQSLYQDLLGRHGRQVDETLLARGSFHTHQDLADALLAEALPRQPQLILVAQALPDLLPFTAVAPYIDHLLHGNGTQTLCLGVSQTGIAAPFVALRIAAAYAGQSPYRDAAIFILEQATLPASRPGVDAGNLADTGVLLLTGSGGGGRHLPLHVRRAPDAATLESLVREILAQAPGDAPEHVILGHALPWEGLGVPVTRARPDQYTTGVWSALAALDPPVRRVLVADADPGSGDYHLAVLASPATAAH